MPLILILQITKIVNNKISSIQVQKNKKNQNTPNINGDIGNKNISKVSKIC